MLLLNLLKIRIFQKYAANNLYFFNKFSCNLSDLLYNYICVIRYIILRTVWGYIDFAAVLYTRKEFSYDRVRSI